MGAQQDTDPAEPGTLSLVAGNQKLRVAILKNDAFIQRNKTLEIILTLTAQRGTSSLVYLAAPRLLGTAIDAALFRSHGIGFIIFDERRIEEVVAPQPAQASRTHETSSYGTDAAVATELATLKSMYAEMERNITRLREELKGFQEIPRCVPNHSTTGEPINQQALLQSNSIFTSQGAQLPSFFSNNPWLDVLSKRGRFEEDRIAA